MKLILTVLTIFIGGHCFAQLASEKPMDQVYSQQVKKKLAEPRTNSAPAKQLPSEAPMPRQVTTAAAKAPKNNVAISEEEKKKKLPGNAKNLPAVKSPKKQIQTTEVN
jgi:hypothetical protein